MNYKTILIAGFVLIACLMVSGCTTVHEEGYVTFCREMCHQAWSEVNGITTNGNDFTKCLCKNGAEIEIPSAIGNRVGVI